MANIRGKLSNKIQHKDTLNAMGKAIRKEQARGLAKSGITAAIKRMLKKTK